MSLTDPNIDASGLLQQSKPSRRKAPSEKQLNANRRNALKSTGPRSEFGKKRVSRNAVKHGLCTEYSHFPTECGNTFNTFVDELEEELRPRSIMQRSLFPQIVHLLWTIRRLPEVQTKLFAEETAKVQGEHPVEPMAVSEIFARRFSDDPSNGFILLNRYERSMQNALLRLMRQ